MNRLLRVGTPVLLVSLIAGSASSAPSTSSHRYPFDPVCSWGRIADGRGMFVRCLTQDEAQHLLAPTSQPAKGATPNPDNGTAATPTTSATPVPVTAASTAPATSNNVPATEPLSAELVSVVPEEGKLPLAEKKLSIPLERYVACVQEHGGLQGTVGQVVVKFLVRERGRAEGSSVEKYQGVTEAAARCIANVVDRRPTGTPEAPMVAASATIRVFRHNKR